MASEGQESLLWTLLAATLSQVTLNVTKELFPYRTYFDLDPAEKQTVADHVRNLLQEVQATFSASELLSPRENFAFPPQREEEYL